MEIEISCSGFVRAALLAIAEGVKQANEQFIADKSEARANPTTASDGTIIIVAFDFGENRDLPRIKFSIPLLLPRT